MRPLLFSLRDRIVSSHHIVSHYKPVPTTVGNCFAIPKTTRQTPQGCATQDRNAVSAL